MKVFICFFCSIATIYILCGCKKDNGQSSVDSDLIGSWELRKSEGSITKNFSPGNGSIYQFTDTAYSTFSNKVLIKKGHYTVIEDTTASSQVGLVISPGQYTNRIIFDNDTLSNKIFFQISANKLSLLSGFFPLDGGSIETYEKE